MSKRLKTSPAGVQRFYRAWRALSKDSRWQMPKGRHTRQRYLLEMAEASYDYYLENEISDCAIDMAREFHGDQCTREQCESYEQHPTVIRTATRNIERLSQIELYAAVLEETSYF